MENFSVKSFVAGAVIGLLGITTIHAASAIHSVRYNDTKVTLNGTPLSLKNPLVSVVDEDNKDFAKTYMPLREVLETLGYYVTWDEYSNTVCLKTGSWIEGNAIIRRVPIQFGYQSYKIDLEENPEDGSKWECIVPDGGPITLLGDEYLPNQAGADGKTGTRRVTFSIPHDFPGNYENELVIIFEQTIDGKKTGNKIIYQVEAASVLVGKPVIYLYPEEKMDIHVNLDFDGVLTFTYPEYNNGWYVTAFPDGRIVTPEDGKEYSYLFWEGVGSNEFDFTKGFVVKGEDTVAFLQNSLYTLGLTPKEANEFIVYWAPKMIQNPYNLK